MSEELKFTDLQRAKLEAHQLRVQLAQARAIIAELDAKLASSHLTAERQALTAEIVTDPSYRIDWDKLELVKQDAEKPQEPQ